MVTCLLGPLRTVAVLQSLQRPLGPGPYPIPAPHATPPPKPSEVLTLSGAPSCRGQAWNVGWEGSPPRGEAGRLGLVVPTLRASTRHAGHAAEAQPPRRAKAASGGTTPQPVRLVDAVSRLGSWCVLPGSGLRCPHI